MAKKPDTAAADQTPATDDEPQLLANENLVPDQQTGGTNDAVTQASVQVEPVKPAVTAETPPPVVGQHDSSQTKVAYAPKAELEVPAADQTNDLPPFDAFVRKHEDAAAALGVVVTGLTHPDAPDTNGIYEGRDAGIRVAKGDHAAQYSDGSNH